MCVHNSACLLAQLLHEGLTLGRLHVSQPLLLLLKLGRMLGQISRLLLVLEPHIHLDLRIARSRLDVLSLRQSALERDLELGYLELLALVLHNVKPHSTWLSYMGRGCVRHE